MGTRLSTPQAWGVTAAEAGRHYRCDDFLPDPGATWFRAVSVQAPHALVFRWLCQLKVAPYSYDLLDNYGKRSPRELTAGAGELADGQPVMTIFELISFEPDADFTIRMRPGPGLRLFGEFVISYTVTPEGRDRSRLVVKLLLGNTGGALARARRRALAWGDLMMMRKQLHTLRDLAERQHVRDAR